jgi:transmembrane sensor
MKRPVVDPFEAAARWVARGARGPLTPEEQDALDRFLAVPENAQAYAEAGALWGESGNLMRRQDAAKRRRRKVAVGAVACVAAVVMAPGVWLRLQADVIAGPGAIKEVDLPDGSHARLAAGSALAIDYSPGVRRLRLLQGEGEFTAAPDASRPFVVEADGGETRALGTVFLVEHQAGGGVRVTGVVHRIEVAHDGATKRLSPNESVTYGGNVATVSGVAVAPSDAGDWRRGALVFSNRPLGEAAEELSRWRGAPIFVLGSDLARQPISGVFRIGEGEAIAATFQAASSLKLRTIELPGGMLIITRR